jgi:hypothetical protein
MAKLDSLRARIGLVTGRVQQTQPEQAGGSERHPTSGRYRKHADGRQRPKPPKTTG